MLVGAKEADNATLLLGVKDVDTCILVVDAKEVDTSTMLVDAEKLDVAIPTAVEELKIGELAPEAVPVVKELPVLNSIVGDAVDCVFEVTCEVGSPPL